jgi:hypothetical protein
MAGMLLKMNELTALTPPMQGRILSFIAGRDRLGWGKPRPCGVGGAASGHVGQTKAKP